MRGKHRTKRVMGGRVEKQTNQDYITLREIKKKNNQMNSEWSF